MSAELEPYIRSELALIGVPDPDPADELHVRLVETFRRMRGSSRGSLLIALEWVFNWDLERKSAEFARAKSDYESLLARHIVRFRDGGEKSGEMCTNRAEALDDVAVAHLRYRLAEGVERLARRRLDTIAHQTEVWRTEQANERAADAFTARQQT